jgi:hypothetical protein
MSRTVLYGVSQGKVSTELIDGTSGVATDRTREILVPKQCGVELISIVPAKGVPQQRVVNRLLSDVQVRLPDCRRSWWLTRRTTCLANRWAIVRARGRIELLSKPAPRARQIAEAEYDPANEHVHVVFQDGTTEQVKL